MSTSTAVQTYDAAVIGAGFGGVYGVHKFANELGLNVIGFEKADGPAGTWYWNRYPGALSDTESHLYRYSFDKELLNDGHWENTYLTQPEILAYFEDVVDRLDVRRHFRFGTEVTSSIYLEDEGLWELTAGGETYRARYVLNAVGLLSAVNMPDIPGAETFDGQILHTGAWPEGIDLSGKRVGVVGSGSTGTQVVTALAPEVTHLTHFVRTPQYSVPVGKRPVSEAERQEVKANYDQIWDQVKNSAVAFGFEEATTPAMSVSEEERQRVFQEAWDKGGGFRFMFGTFGDIATDLEANEAAASFIRGKISEIIEDPETARKLTPHDLYARRPLCDNGFYETFNRDNVEVVALKETPFKEITPDGVLTSDGQLHELDVLIFATGFDAVDGNYRRMEILGRGGEDINEHWQGQPTSYLGVATSNFPNWFMVLGPNGPFTNLPPSIETQVEWISELIKYADDNGIKAIEPKQSTVDEWTETCTEIAEATVFTKVDSWIFGANVPGKKPSVLFYLGGLGNYRSVLNDEATAGYPGFSLT
ncbi:flavin-containing monooxygenase [Corynebacterium tapiri]|uniref:NAD(P)/FAD-dependent oxidoreductase n=1 Tax=Corynebacterium tapiri TaxID=1448266 RepID=A0A5C4U6D0_9CORY|nr:NAD(P)/FAD-dependent oxidoreductase [Corynebacterium tapiri]TNL99334.1 NAD(P)/FAD-dependent oxidoreductase [Corynebacterium tapiri]